MFPSLFSWGGGVIELLRWAPHVQPQSTHYNYSSPFLCFLQVLKFLPPTMEPESYNSAEWSYVLPCSGFDWGRVNSLMKNRPNYWEGLARTLIHAFLHGQSSWLAICLSVFCMKFAVGIHNAGAVSDPMLRKQAWLASFLGLKVTKRKSVIVPLYWKGNKMACACTMLPPDMASLEPCAIHSHAKLGNMLQLEVSWLN